MPDTASTAYRIGYEIGSWLPLVVLVGLYLLILYFGWKRKNRKVQGEDESLIG